MVITLAGIALPEDIRWVDRYSAKRALTNIERTISGKQIIERSLLTYGWDITLVGGAEFGWMDKAAVDAVHALYGHDPATTPPLTLVIDGVSHLVYFKDDGMSFDPVQWYNAFEPGDHFIPTLNLYTVGSTEAINA